jgi:hypothetical protein
MPVRSRSELFDVDPNEFVAERDQLARDLKAAGDKDEAAAVRKLRRPTVAMWAINQVARREPGSVEQLIEQAADARAAQREAIEQSKPERLREALARRREALAKVSRAAREVIDGSGRSGDAQDRDIESALNALVASGHMDVQFRAGELIALPAAEGESGDFLSELAASMPASPRPAKPPAELIAAREEVETRRAELDDANRAVEAVESTLAAAHKAQAAAARAVERAEERLTKLER